MSRPSRSSLPFSSSGRARIVCSFTVLALVATSAACGSSDAGKFADPNGDAGADGATSEAGGTDTGSSTCPPGKSESGACGKCGTHLRVCNANATWSEWSTCANETGACTPGEADDQACGDGTTKTRVCSAECAWGAFSACTSTTACTPSQTGEEACGKCGKRVRVCSAAGVWSDWSLCNGEGVCAAGTMDDLACGIAGKKSRTCLTSCTWGAYGDCVGDITPCTNGSTENMACEKCGTSVRVCGSDLKWSNWSNCSNQGACAIGAKETESCTGGGQRARSCTDSCAWGAWSSCPSGNDPAELWALRGAFPGGTTSVAMAISVERIRLSDQMVLGTIAIPSAAAGANKPLTVRSDHLGEGQLLRSGDGHWVTLAGYGATTGTAAPAAAASSTVPRVLGRINAAGTVDTSTATTAFSTGVVRGAASANGSSFFAFGAANYGIVLVPHGGSGAGTTINTDETGIADFVDGQLWYSRYSTASGYVLSYATPPTTTTSATIVIAGSASVFTGLDPWGFVAFSTTGTTRDRVYIAEGTTDAVDVWVKGASAWTKEKTITVGSGYEPRWLTGFQRGSEFVLFATAQGTSTTTLSKIVTFVDTVGTTIPTVTTLKTGTATAPYLGIAFAPN